MTRLARCGAVAAALAAFLGGAGVAAAVTSFQGSDYSYDTNARKKIVTCDAESDSHKTHADYYYGINGSVDANFGIVKDGDGNNGVCGSASVGTTGDGRQLYITKHRTCEELVLQPDQCGNWQTTS